jgi:hypothetical protein
MSWLKDLISMKTKINSLNNNMIYYKNEIYHQEKHYHSDENIKKVQLDKIAQHQDKYNNKKQELSQLENKYSNELEKYDKDGIVTYNMIEEIIKRGRDIRGIQSNINILGDTKYELEEEQKEQMDQIQEKYNQLCSKQ